MRRVLQSNDRKKAARLVKKSNRRRVAMLELAALKRRKAAHDRAERMATAGKLVSRLPQPFLVKWSPRLSLPMLERAFGSRVGQGWKIAA